MVALKGTDSPLRARVYKTELLKLAKAALTAIKAAARKWRAAPSAETLAAAEVCAAAAAEVTYLRRVLDVRG